MFRFITVSIICVLSILLGATGCASDERGAPASTAERALESRPLDLLLVDCSPSFRREGLAFTAQISQVVLDSATRGRRVWAACFDASPLRTLRWEPKVDFAVLPDAVTNSPEMIERVTQARALGLGKQIEPMIKNTPYRARGSGQLESLEVIAKTPQVGRAFIFTDLITNEVDGVRLASATGRDLKAAVERWRPRLGNGLKDVQVFIVGFGKNAPTSEAARRGEKLFADLLTAAGAHVSITQDLPADLVLKGSGR